MVVIGPEPDNQEGLEARGHKATIVVILGKVVQAQPSIDRLVQVEPSNGRVAQVHTSIARVVQVQVRVVEVFLLMPTPLSLPPGITRVFRE